MFMLINYMYSKIKKIILDIIIRTCPNNEYLMKKIASYQSEQFDSSDLSEQLEQLDKFDELNYSSLNKHVNIRNNTTPNLQINKKHITRNYKSYPNFPKHIKEINIEWFCQSCNKKLSQYNNIFCCNDFIFCSTNGRDRFLNIKFQINNNI